MSLLNWMTMKILCFHSSSSLCSCNNASVNDWTKWNKSILIGCIAYFNWRSICVDVFIETSLSYVCLICSSIFNDSGFFPCRSITRFVTVIVIMELSVFWSFKKKTTKNYLYTYDPSGWNSLDDFRIGIGSSTAGAANAMPTNNVKKIILNEKKKTFLGLRNQVKYRYSLWNLKNGLTTSRWFKKIVYPIKVLIILEITTPR